ncbi:MAG TPA: beta-ketoacyl-ACP synthase III [Polyangiales bacterium]|nr:beta-ketoacyl-ACP synthase III [Polyangiales bacterium]
MRNAFISGTGFYAPPRVVTNDSLRTEYGIDTTHEWIEQRTGIQERHFADEGVGCSDIAVPAAEEAIKNAGLEKRDIDLIIFCTLSPDMHFPGSGVFLQKKLGLCDQGRFIPALDLRNQCSGFLYGLSTAHAMVRAGTYNHVLLVGAEVHSAALDLSTRGRQVASLFGDGAGAVVVSATEEDRGIRTVHLGADGRFAEILCQPIWDIAKKPYIPVDTNGVGQVQPEMMYARMDGKQVFRHAVERMIGSLMQVMQSQKITLNDIDLFTFHQANLRINQFIQQQIGAPDSKFINNIQRYGNTTAATIPGLLSEAERTGRLKRGMKVAMVAFGSGFTWGAAIVDW